MSGDGLPGPESIESLLAELGRRCAAQGIKAEMFLVGGGAMALAYSRGRVTRDLDAAFEPMTLVYAEARKMADDLGLPPDWLNDGVKGLMPDRTDDAARVQYASEGLTVMVASPEYLFAMKAAAARQEADTDDLLVLARSLKVTTAGQAFGIIERYYSPQRLTAKSRFFIEETFSARSEPEDSTPEVSADDPANPPARPTRAGRRSKQQQRKPR